MIEKNILKKTIDILMSRGADFCDIFVEKKNNLSIVIENKKLEKIISGMNIGIGLRVCYKNKTFFGYIESLNEKKIFKLAESLVKKENYFFLNKNNNKKNEKKITLKKSKNIYICQKKIKYQLKNKIDFMLNLNNYAWKNSSLLSQILINYNESSQEVLIMNSNSVYVKDFRPRVRIFIESIAEKKGLIQRAYNVYGGLGDFSYFKIKKIIKIIDNAKSQSKKLLFAKKSPIGKMDVVISGKAGGTMIHEACGHGLEGDLIKKEASVYAGKVNKIVASNLITVIDDGTIKGFFGSSYYDDEGIKTKKNILINKGKLEKYMLDLKTSREFKLNPTGNGRREGYYCIPITRMTNTYIKPGKDKKEDIISSVENGLFIKKMGGGQVNTITGDFVFEVVEGYIIRKGKIREQVRGATLIGNGPDVLKKIDKVGNDFGISLGMCGKDSQNIPVGDAQPTIRIPKIIVGGIN